MSCDQHYKPLLHIFIYNSSYILCRNRINNAEKLIITIYMHLAGEGKGRVSYFFHVCRCLLTVYWYQKREIVDRRTADGDGSKRNTVIKNVYFTLPEV